MLALSARLPPKIKSSIKWLLNPVKTDSKIKIVFTFFMLIKVIDNFAKIISLTTSYLEKDLFNVPFDKKKCSFKNQKYT